MKHKQKLVDLREHRLSPVAIIEDEQPQKEGEGKRLVFEAVVAEADFVNQNRRIYPLDVLWGAFQKVNAAVENYPGAVDHPGSYYQNSFTDTGIKWHAFWLENKTVKGRGEIVWTAKGRDLAAHIEAGMNVGFSTRTLALTEDDTIDGEPVRRVTFMEPPFVDAVLSPSVKHAQLANFHREAVEEEDQGQIMDEKYEKVLIENGQLKADLERAKADLEKATSATAEAVRAVEEALAAEQAAHAETRAKLVALESAAALDSKLAELTAGHRFAPTIVAEARRMGVTMENVAVVVERLKHLTEGVATSSATGTSSSKGIVKNDKEDAVEGVSEDDKGLTAEQEAELVAAGLLPRNKKVS